MSASASNTAVPPPSSTYRPFECHICHSRFTRHENLKRHAALHVRAADKASFPCDFCSVTFSRCDLRNRHLKRKHPEWSGREAKRRAERDPTRSADSGSCLVSAQAQVSCLSTPDAQHNRGSQSSCQQDGPSDIGLQSNDALWTTALQSPQPRLHDCHPYPDSERPGISASVPPDVDDSTAHDITNWLARQQQQSTDGSPRTDITDRGMNEFQKSQSLDSTGLTLDHRLDSRSHTTNGSQSTFSDMISDNASYSEHVPDGLSSKDKFCLQDNWFPSAAQATRGYHLYFTHVSHFVAFLHRPTFDATETESYLGLSMLCLAYQHGEDPDCGEQPGSGMNLSLRCFHRARVLAASEEENTDSISTNVSLVQAYWLLEVCAMMYLCGRDSTYGLKLHSRMISLTRFGGLTQPMHTEPTTTEDLEVLWRDFIKAESHKRTLLAVHQIDALWYQLFSIPRSLSHLEIKHDLPCQESCWTASSSTQWATRQLTVRQPAPLILYSDAVRLVLSPDPDISSLPQFDLYGAINIAQFLLSSAREVSGWSTMTGRLSLERFQPLQSSLVALEHLIRPRDGVPNSVHLRTCEATWEMAMIELQMWSLSHTGGIVGGSVDAFLEQSTYLASSCETSYGPEFARAIQPHVIWFLRFLDADRSSDLEPPWIVLYAYKAFLIAWQLMRSDLPEIMEVVGVRDGDVHEAVTWAKKVFGHGQRRQLSKLVLSCLDTLTQ